MSDNSFSSPGLPPQQGGATPWNAICKVRKELERFRRRRSREQWFLAYQFGSAGGPPAQPGDGFQELVPPRDRFWADPFPVERDGQYFLFFEEFLHRTHRGRIVASQFEPARGLSPFARRGLSPFAESAEQKGTVPFSAGGRPIGAWSRPRSRARGGLPPLVSFRFRVAQTNGSWYRKQAPIARLSCGARDSFPAIGLWIRCC